MGSDKAKVNSLPSHLHQGVLLKKKEDDKSVVVRVDEEGEFLEEIKKQVESGDEVILTNPDKANNGGLVGFGKSVRAENIAVKTMIK